MSTSVRHHPDYRHFAAVMRNERPQCLSCAQIRRMPERILPRYDHLDCIVLMVGASDLVRWLELGTPPAPWKDPVPLSHVFEPHPWVPFGWSPRRVLARAIVGSLARAELEPGAEASAA